MKLSEEISEQYTCILQEELITALGCTEPICVAYAAAVVRGILGCQPQSMLVESSRNIIKNVKGAVVPNSGGLKGIAAAAVLGAIGGDATKGLEVLTTITAEDLEKTKRLLQNKDFCQIKSLKSTANLHIRIRVKAQGHEARIELIHQHTNIVLLEKDGEIKFQKPFTEDGMNEALTDRKSLNVSDIKTFADEVEIEKVQKIIEKQISYNEKIAMEGLIHQYGVCVGQSILKNYGNDVKIRACAKAAAGSDARMGGCLYPVVINSGSGNQGITVSLPVIEYARELKVSHEKLIRALVFSNLIAIHQKTYVGRLSGYCGAVSAACGSGAGITYLCGGTYEQICATITNTLANVSGIICDGAKPSCAAKIASAVDAAIMGHCLAMDGKQFISGDGIVKDQIEETISCVGEIASEGMRATDEKILEVMLR